MFFVASPGWVVAFGELPRCATRVDVVAESEHSRLGRRLLAWRRGEFIEKLVQQFGGRLCPGQAIPALGDIPGADQDRFRRA
jgi:hypothetical protein